MGYLPQGIISLGDADAAVGEVLSPRTFYSVAVPKKTGAMPTVALAVGNNAYPTGYHAGAASLQAIDANLAVGNIKSGVNVFGYVGTVIQQGTETIEKYADATIAAGVTYTPAASGIFFSMGRSGGAIVFGIQYYSTVAGGWYSAVQGNNFMGSSAIGNGVNFRIVNSDVGDREYCLMRHYYSTGTYERNKDEQLASLTAYTPAVSGFFADAEQVYAGVELQINMTTAGWSLAQEGANGYPLTIVIGDGTNLRVYNTSGTTAYYHITMRAKLT